ncbi:sugar phosphate isomerase/epimerase family protein [Metabacillus arenae]|uniref:Sugar phosphate isomerase/epimerase n=1 Tax=Metabacillus arenae TaxID=2771434 RepID=A0A926NH85_9BACI|nr:sugar phosphate isomerase/epimerase family protein [Metabacillus arenae]MBD1381025.1 sugar phosphate isomerase/epimerase [Metabacillus arenae]
MKLGVSSYSFYSALQSGEMTIVDAIHWIKANNGEHIEIVPIGFTLDDNDSLIADIVKHTKEVGIEISNYAVEANFVDKNERQFQDELENLKRQVDIANRLGVKRMRHDVASRPRNNTSIIQFERDLPIIVEVCKEIADYAAEYGIITSIENHGYHVQHADRVNKIVHLVDRDNFRTTLDVGNFLCVDEDPLSSVIRNLSIASMVHVKDFYIRPFSHNPGDGFFQTTTGNYLRGAIVGHGDVDIPGIVKVMQSSGYDGHISLEFEGMEECKNAIKIGLDNIRRIWNGK